MRSIFAAGMLGSLLFAPNLSSAEFKPETIRAGKAATVVVGGSRARTVSGYCFDKRGYFLTAMMIRVGTKVPIALHSGTPQAKLVEAEVIRTDEVNGLSVLKISGAKGLVALPLGDNNDLIETQQVVVFGYKYTTIARLRNKEFPPINFGVRHIESLRKKDGKLADIGLDRLPVAGSAGGPVLDESGKVIGLTRGAGVLPVRLLTTLLSKPEVSFGPQEIEFAQRGRPTDFAINVESFLPNQKSPEVELILGEKGAERVYQAKLDKGKYHVKAVPLPANKNEPPLAVEVAFADSLVRGTLENRPLKIDKFSTKLSDVQVILRQDKGWKLVNTRDKEHTLAKLDLGDLKVVVGGKPLAVDIARLKSITVFPAPPPPNKVPFVVRVKQGKQVLMEQRGTLTIAGTPEARLESTPMGAYRPPTARPEFKDRQLIYRLSEPYTSMTTGGHGRFLIFHLKNARQVAVFDILKAKIVHEIEQVADDVLLAAGADKLLLVVPSQNLVQRFSLHSFEREKVGQLPGKGIARIAVLGANSRGPLLVGTESEANLIDIDSLKPLEIKGKVIGAAGRRGAVVRVSADGQVFTSIPVGIGPVPYERMVIERGRTDVNRFGSTSNAVRWAQPTAAGTLLAVAGDELYAQNLRKLESGWTKGMVVFPTVDPRYFIAVRFAPDIRDQKKTLTYLKVGTVADRREIYAKAGFEEMAPKGRTSERYGISRRLLEAQPHFAYVPWAGLLVLIEYDNQRIHLSRFDVMETLHSSGVSYLFVDSLPPGTVFRGENLAYPIKAHSNEPRLTYHLESGPPGMEVSKEGLVTWQVPAGFPDREAAVIVAVNAKGREILHSFSMNVLDKVKVIEGN